MSAPNHTPDDVLRMIGEANNKLATEANRLVLEQAIRAVFEQRDSLAAALREISDDYRFTHESDQSHPYWGDRAKAYAETARAALAKLDVGS